MSRVLYDLCTADREVRPSPFCWLVKFALLHKGLDFETKPLRFTDKADYPDPEHGKLPILVDNGEVVKDSLDIVAHLERKYPQKPLTATAGERAAAAFYGAWLGTALFPALGPTLIPRVHAAVDEADKDYFRKTREARFGKTLEELAATPGMKEKTESALGLLSAPLASHAFLGGDAPNLSDYIVVSPLMWQRSLTLKPLYDTPAPVNAWIERMLDLYDGFARSAKSVEAA